MSLLLRRELLRLAPYGVAGALLILAAPLVFALDRSDGRLALLLGALLTPAVLGIATVAPDTGSGATAFFTRLPLSPARLLATKVAAAVVWAAVVHLATRLALAWMPGAANTGDPYPLLAHPLAGQVCGLGLGCLASAVAPRTLPAIFLAPSLAVGGLLVLLGVPLVAWRIPLDLGLAGVVAPGLGLIALAAAALAFLRGEPHRTSARPALLAAAVVAPALILGIGVTGVAHAWTIEAAECDLVVGPTLGVASPGEHALVAVQLSGERWIGPQSRVALLGHGKDRTSLVLPLADVASPEFSPDGGRLLLRSTREPGGWLVDLAGRWERLPGLAPEGFGFPWVAWRANEPLLVREQGEWLETFLPDPALPVARRPELEPALLTRVVRAPLEGRLLVGALHDGRVVLADREGLVAVNPPTPARDVETGPQMARLEPGARLFAWPEGPPVEAAVSPRARSAVRVAPDDATALEVLGPPGQPPRRVQSPSPSPAALSLSRERLGWSPEERFLALALPGGLVWVVDLVAAMGLAELEGASARVVRVEPSAAGPAIWSSGIDAWVATPAGDRLELGSGRRSWLPVPAASGLGEDRFVPLSRPLRREELQGGAR